MEIEINIAPVPGRRIASTGGYVIEWNGHGRLADIYSSTSYNMKVATLAAGGVVLDHGPSATVQVMDWDFVHGRPADGVDLESVDLLEVLEDWIGGAR